MVGLEVNLRGLTFKDVKLTTETVDGKPVLVIEGVIIGEAQEAGRIAAAALSRARRAGRGNLRLERGAGAAVLKPGERAWFRSRLASPPPEGRNIDVRFFNKRDIAAGSGLSAAVRRECEWSDAAILIADDEESMRTLVARAIAMDGHDIVTAEDGAEALEILTRENGAFDLLLTDIKMPVMDGIALALAAARDFPELTILLMTGFADQRERAHRPQCHRARRRDQAVFGRRYPHRGGRCAGGEEGG